jgi:hypothetical protein
MPSGLGGFDQLAAELAESFVPYVSENVFQSARVIKAAWDAALKVDEGRYLALPLATDKNNTAQSFGQYDVLASGPQSLWSVAAFPWSFYQAAVTLDYITLKLVRGPNMRIDNLTGQVQMAIASLSDLIDGDLCSLTKGASTQAAQPAYGIIEASDNGQLYNVYGNIARTGTNSFGNWQGEVISLPPSQLGNAINDFNRGTAFRNYAACSVGDATPTDVFSTQQGVASYMYGMDSMLRVSPGDSANPYLGNPNMLGARVTGDNHIATITNNGHLGYNYYFLNMNHTRMYYFGEKGFDFVPWIDTPGILSKTARYIIAFQLASDQPRLNGWMGPFNDILNL